MRFAAREKGSWKFGFGMVEGGLGEEDGCVGGQRGRKTDKKNLK